MARVASGRQAKPAPATTPSISKYARVSKNQSLSDKSEKKVLAVCLPNSKSFGPVTVTTSEDSSDEENHNTQSAPAPAASTEQKTATTSNKRKASTDDDGGLVDAWTAPSKSSKRSRTDRDLPGDLSLGPPVLLAPPTIQTTKSKRSDRQSRGAADAHRKSRQTTLIASAKKDGRKPTQKSGRSRKARADASSESSTAEKACQRGLPTELLELLDLQRTILKTVALKITHQNNNTPIDISSITQHVSRAWGKRQVTVDDIRRCVAIQDIKAPDQNQGQVSGFGSPLIVTDYGRGKLCLELDTTRSVGPIDENKLCQQFEGNLRVLCAERATDEMSDLDMSFESLSFNDLPKADINPRSQHITGKQNPLLAKGQRALADLKRGIASKQQEKEAARGGAPQALTPNANGSKMSLLDRLRAKEAANAQVELPSGPELARKRALLRVPDVASIIGMLASSSSSTGAPVLSYTMPVLQQKLKDSLRVPMPVEEGIDTVKLIAAEVAPEWLRVVSMGGKEHVVIQARSKPYDSEIAARLSRLEA